jgi:hypothetical protein
MALTTEQLARLKELHAQYGGPSSVPEEKQGLLKSIAMGTGIPRFAANVVNAGKQIGNLAGMIKEGPSGDYQQYAQPAQNATPVNMPWLGAVKPVGQEGTFGQRLADTTGESLKLASTVVSGGSGVGAVGRATLAGRIGQGAMSGLKGGVVSGGMYGMGEGIQQKDATLGSIVGSTAGSAVLGGAFGGAVGAVLSAVSAAVRGTYRNVTTPAEQKARQEIAILFEKGVKPNLPGKTTPALRTKFNDAVGEGVQIINSNKPSLQFTDDIGDTVSGRAPQTLKEFSDALEQTEKIIYDKYDDLAKQANQKGVTIDPTPIAKELDEVINNKALQLSHPEAIRYAKDVQERFMQVGEIDAKTAQEVIKNYNNSLQAFYRNPTPEGMTRNAVDAMMVNRVRKALDEGIEGATDGGYQALKNQYGSLKTIERDVMRATLRDARKNVKGLIDYTDIFSGGQIVNGILSANPATIASGATQKAIATYFKFLNNPNRAIQKMFEIADGLPKPDQRLSSSITNPAIAKYTNKSQGNTIASPTAATNMSKNPAIDATVPQATTLSSELSTKIADQTQNNIVMALIDEGDKPLANIIAKIDMTGVTSADDIARKIAEVAGDDVLKNTDVLPHLQSAKQIFEFQAEKAAMQAAPKASTPLPQATRQGVQKTSSAKSTMQKVKDAILPPGIPRNEGKVKLPFTGKIVNAIDEPTKKELARVVRYLEWQKKTGGTDKYYEDIYKNLAKKYEFPENRSLVAVKNHIARLLEKTKTTGTLPGTYTRKPIK